ncbi:MAG TPA: hypothetical protein H9875_03235 [Candidatus Levilactobacillus faecigallinarum]|uniref:Bacterial archaeo-eukaryotic release factor family 6 domain-containing protein n=1 Tax=Candidatus Levilactobacillus faecigallinarum TaxID=2838638 RepID=A0A9D1QRT3_9LACO|nr:hypothetical protein [Candidatus Levilactobacillus faecigallinarum]
MANHFDIHAALSLAQRPGPFVTITLPVTGQLAADRTQFQSLMQTAKQRLTILAPNRDWGAYQPAFAPFAHGSLTHGNARGLLIMAGATTSFHYWLHTPTQPTVAVTYQPNVLPILAARQAHGDYDVLFLKRTSFQVARVRSGQPELVDLPADAPATLETALGTETRERGRWQRSNGTDQGTHYSGTGSLDRMQAADTRNYFQVVDRYVLDNYSQPGQRPLVLVAAPQDQGNFRQWSRNRFLVADVTLNERPNLANETLAQITARIDAQWHQRAVESRRGHYDQARSANQLVTDLGLLATLTGQGQISDLWLRDDAFQAGHLDSQGNIVTLTALSRQNNLYNDLALAVCRRGGTVRVLPAADLPTDQVIVAKRLQGMPIPV